MNEAGTTKRMDPQRALSRLAASNEWLKERLANWGSKPPCECGACYVCDYNTVREALDDLKEGEQVLDLLNSAMPDPVTARIREIREDRDEEQVGAPPNIR